MNDFMEEYRRRAGEAGAGCGPRCPGNRIPLTPYEAARIADGLGITTGELIRHYLDGRTAVLTVKDDGTCVFHREGEGCEVHGDRPLACRSFVEPADQPGRFVERARQYREVLRAWRRAGLAREAEAGDGSERAGGNALATAGGGPQAERQPHPAPDLGTWILDVDSLVTQRCAERGLTVPGDLEARVDIHLEALRAALE
ncbi:MAG: YkgJ family cysteine cluster protein [Gemmatimonadota bacterium]|nr:YkgJ family cysteine cluster protein [Gemmatimonadota bacterium]